MKRCVARLAAVPAALLLGLALGVSPAYAGTTTSWAVLYDGVYKSGGGKFYHDGDILRACDDQANGKGVWAGLYHYETSAAFSSIYNGSGAGACASKTIDLVEGTNVYVLVCDAVDGKADWSRCARSSTGQA
ncbi:hypothetical protein ACIGW1_34560 [Streptomyces sp. NPDC053780]|uniref:hypothetical protein n=1 Tax=unclassified Streptomyces TaxID=2593676 RepID=UPI0034141006